MKFSNKGDNNTMKTVQMGPLNTFKQRAAHIALGLGLAATLAFGAVMPASADDGVGTVTLVGGTPSSIFTDATFDFTGAGLTLSGVNDVATAIPVIAVLDPSGSSAGWNVTMSSTAFVSGLKTLEAAPQVLSATLTDNNAAGATHPNGVTYSSAVDIAGAGGPIASSVADESSNGAFTLTPTIQIAIPYDTELATYTSTITVTMNVGP